MAEAEKIYIAHIDKDGVFQSVDEHLKGVAEYAKKFADVFGFSEVGYVSGLLHDVGKFSKEFQQYITDPSIQKRVDHSTAGAKEVGKLYSNPYFGIICGMIIAGHHSGLLNCGNKFTSNDHDGTYLGRLKSSIPNYSAWNESAIKSQLLTETVECNVSGRDGFSLSFLIRMLYSCLVDADYLDTESFMQGKDVSRGNYPTLDKLLDLFNTFISGWLNHTVSVNDPVPYFRNKVLIDCIEKGKEYGRGIYTLTVPTGGGKTTSSMAFALNTAIKNKIDRIIYVIPYTSIIDQTAKTFEDIFGEENVIEHHSGIIYSEDENGIYDSSMLKKMLATENWDAPIIITTAVQFFESLFASKSSKCRKLHNICNSVIIFDEIQTLPMELLRPCVKVMAELAQNYRCLEVLCSATQPALENIFEEFLPNCNIKEICDNTNQLFNVFRRVAYKDCGKIDEDSLLKKIREKNECLCILNTRKDAQKIFSLLDEDGDYCLTTLLCPHDRKQKINEIKERLKNNQHCVVIATSLVEAGIDFDFPIVFREKNGLDSILQAGGRCNREGRRPKENSYVCIFSLSPDKRKNTALQQRISILEMTQDEFISLDKPEAIESYFINLRKYYGKENLDSKDILNPSQMLFFKDIAGKFNFISNDTKTIYIPKDDYAKDLLQKIETGEANKNTYRRLSQYGVEVYNDQLKKLNEIGAISKIDDWLFVLNDINQYDPNFGLKMDPQGGESIFI